MDPTNNNFNFIDHLIYTTPNLEMGMDEMEDLFGIRPAVGGKHPDFGTHNALLSLGNSTYLEIISRDPELGVPESGIWLRDNLNQPSQLSTWALRTENIEELYIHGIRNELPLGKIAQGKRQKPDGTSLQWKLTDPYAMPCDGAIPFLISWGKSPHPANSAPHAGELIDFEIFHPNPNEVKEKLMVLGVDFKVTQSNKCSFRATVIKDRKEIVLE